MHSEIDLLHIVKQLRVTAFASEILLKPHQPQLIKWFNQYKLKIRPGERFDNGDISYAVDESMVEDEVVNVD